MKAIILIVLLSLPLFAIDIELKNGDTEVGDILCQEKGKIALKSGTEVVTIYLKSIKKIGDQKVEGKKKFTVADSLILKKKNEIVFVNGSNDSCVIKLRNNIDKSIIGEQGCASGKSVYFIVENGTYYEAVKFLRDDIFYYLKGMPFTIESKCNTYEKNQITLNGYKGENPPQTKSSKNSFEN